MCVYANDSGASVTKSTVLKFLVAGRQLNNFDAVGKHGRWKNFSSGSNYGFVQSKQKDFSRGTKSGEMSISNSKL